MNPEHLLPECTDEALDAAVSFRLAAESGAGGETKEGELAPEEVGEALAAVVVAERHPVGSAKRRSDRHGRPSEVPILNLPLAQFSGAGHQVPFSNLHWSSFPGRVTPGKALIMSGSNKGGRSAGPAGVAGLRPAGYRYPAPLKVRATHKTSAMIMLGAPGSHVENRQVEPRHKSHLQHTSSRASSEGRSAGE